MDAFTMMGMSFLEEGKFTKRDELIRKLAPKIADRADFESGKIYPEEITDFISHKLKKEDSKKDEEYRKRTASEIIESGYWNGCTDRALVFVTLARQLGYPTKYVETLSKDWLANPDLDNIHGHCFAKISVKGNDYRIYEPLEGFNLDNHYVYNGKEFIEVGMGLDFSQVFIKDPKTFLYSPEPTNLQSLDKVVQMFVSK